MKKDLKKLYDMHSMKIQKHKKAKATLPFVVGDKNYWYSVHPLTGKVVDNFSFKYK